MIKEVTIVVVITTAAMNTEDGTDGPVEIIIIID